MTTEETETTARSGTSAEAKITISFLREKIQKKEKELQEKIIELEGYRRFLAVIEREEEETKRAAEKSRVESTPLRVPMVHPKVLEELLREEEEEEVGTFRYPRAASKKDKPISRGRNHGKRRYG